MNLLKNITGKNYINGEFIEFGKQISVINPATLKEIATVPNLGLSEINSAINNTVTSFSSWSQSSFEARIAILRRWYNLVIENIEELSHILTLEQGKVLAESKKEILYGSLLLIGIHMLYIIFIRLSNPVIVKLIKLLRNMSL